MKRINGDMVIDGNLSVRGGTGKRLYIKKQADQTFTSHEDIEELTGLEFPSTPDGSKRFRVSVALVVDLGATNGNRSPRLWINSLGNRFGGGKLILFGSYSNTTGVDTFSLHEFIATPSTGDKIGLSLVNADNSDEVWGEDSHPNSFSYLEIVEVVE